MHHEAIALRLLRLEEKLDHGGRLTEAELDWLQGSASATYELVEKFNQLTTKVVISAERELLRLREQVEAMPPESTFSIAEVYTQVRDQEAEQPAAIYPEGD